LALTAYSGFTVAAASAGTALAVNYLEDNPSAIEYKEKAEKADKSEKQLKIID
jgi:hypothetical protein